MNDTTIYIGTYIKAKMPQTRVLSDKKVCPVCTYTSGLHEFCPNHGVELVEFHETGLAHPFDILHELFKDDPDRFHSEFYGDFEDGYVCFMPNRGNQGGQYIRAEDDQEIDIPLYNLDGDWQELIKYLTENEVEHEVKYGVLIVGEK